MDVLAPHRLTVQYRPADMGGPRQREGLRLTSTFGAGVELDEIYDNRRLKHNATIMVKTLTACCMGYADQGLVPGVWCSQCGQDQALAYQVPVFEDRGQAWRIALAQELEARAAAQHGSIDPLALTLMTQSFLVALEPYFAVLPFHYSSIATSTFPLDDHDD